MSEYSDILEKTRVMRSAVEEELMENILPFWDRYSRDGINGGFWGIIENDNTILAESDRSSLICSRILWSFSRAHQEFEKSKYCSLAHWAYEYLVTVFGDKRGGVHEMVDYRGVLLDKSKKTVSQSYAIYGLSEYYRAFNDQKALDRALAIFDFIEDYCYDDTYSGYFNTCEDREGRSNFNKDLSSQIHMLESYTNLYDVSRSEKVKKRLGEMVELFIVKLFNRERGYFPSSYNRELGVNDPKIYYGHNLELLWLLYHCISITGEKRLLPDLESMFIQCIDFIVDRAIDSDSGIMMSGNPDDIIDSHKYWWCQVEGIVAFLYAFNISNDKKYLQFALNTWDFIEKNLINGEHGEWFLRVNRSGMLVDGDYKVDNWKGPYHTVRSCITILNSLPGQNPAGSSLGVG